MRGRWLCVLLFGRGLVVLVWGSQLPRMPESDHELVSEASLPSRLLPAVMELTRAQLQGFAVLFFRPPDSLSTLVVCPQLRVVMAVIWNI